MVRQTPNSEEERCRQRVDGAPVAGGAPGLAALSQEAESTALGSVSLFLLFRIIFFFFFFFFVSNVPTPKLGQ